VYATLLWTWLAVPPSRASFISWAAMMGTYIDDGAYYLGVDASGLDRYLLPGLGAIHAGARVDGGVWSPPDSGVNRGVRE
jgi:hypothetical protein